MSQLALAVDEPAGADAALTLAPGAAWLRGFAAGLDEALGDALEPIARRAPFRHMEVPGGFRMSVAMTNCGPLGWVSDASGYRYTSRDPASGKSWPAMPEVFMQLAQSAALAAGYPGYEPDACLVNLYEPGARLSLHQDRDERDLGAPIVSVSLGVPATFVFGGLRRADPVQRLALTHGDVVVWGGDSRLRYHGLLPLRRGWHPFRGWQRINLTFRKAG